MLTTTFIYCAALSVKQAYPCLNKLADATRGLVCELDVAEEMERNGVVLVGWYHSHPLASPTPTILDIDAQLEYQLKMKGTGEHGYRPCLGVLCCNIIIYMEIDKNKKKRRQSLFSFYITIIY